MVKPHAAIHAFLGFGGPCLGTERSSLLLLWALRGLCCGRAELAAPEGRSPESRVRADPGSRAVCPLPSSAARCNRQRARAVRPASGKRGAGIRDSTWISP